MEEVNNILAKIHNTKKFNTCIAFPLRKSYDISILKNLENISYNMTTKKFDNIEVIDIDGIRYLNFVDQIDNLRKKGVYIYMHNGVIL